MKNRTQKLLALLVLLSALNHPLSTANAQGTAFTYQGQLQNNGAPASGTYNLQFSLYTNSAGGTAVAGPVTNNAVTVSNGLFTVVIDFGAAVWNGQTNWLQIGVETNGGSSFTLLSPLQQVTPTPYAIFAEGANAAGLTGTVPMSSLSGIYGGALSLTNTGNSFTGSGSGLAGVNAAALNGLNATNFWQTGGNTGTSPTNGNFLGTADLQPLEIRVGGLRGWRVEPDPRGDGAANLIGGYINNAVRQPGSGGDFIGGGGYSGGVNIISSNTSGAFIGAGSANLAGPNLNDAVIAGGYGNTISGDGFRSAVAGGYSNTIDEANSTIGGGQNNLIQIYADHTFIGGGQNNTIIGSFTLPVYAVIGGGYGNTIQTNSSYVVIPGGYQNVAGGFGSFAAGEFAQATNSGAFVWSDNSSTNPFSSTTTNQFNVRAMGGVRLVTGGAGMTLDGQPVVPSGNYVFAYSSGFQNVSTPFTFQNAFFSNDAQLNGWTHIPGTPQYTCNQTGLYLVQYTAEASVSDSMSLRGALNFIEIPGSQAFANSSSFGTTTVISKSFLASISSGNILTIQYTGNSSSDSLQSGGSGLPTSISLTITRIQ